MTTFHRAKIGSTTVASAYTAGSGSLAVVDGSQFGSTFPIVVICSRAGVRMSVLEVTARATNTLTVSGAVDGTTDVNLIVGDLVKEGPTALQTNELQDAINALPAYDRFSNLVTPEVGISGFTALTASAFGKLHVCSGTSSDYNVFLPPPAGNAGRFIGFRMSPALTKFVILNRNGSETINGAASRLMWTNEAATLFCDGTNWFKISGRSIPMVAQLRIVGGNPNQAQSIANGTNVKVLLNQTDVDNTGFMADLSNNQIIIRRSGTYTILTIATLAGLSAASPRSIVIGVSNTGGGISQTESYGVSGGFPNWGLPVDYVAAAGELISMLVYQSSGASQWLYGSLSNSNILSAKEQSPW